MVIGEVIHRLIVRLVAHKLWYLSWLAVLLASALRLGAEALLVFTAFTIAD